MCYKDKKSCQFAVFAITGNDIMLLGVDGVNSSSLHKRYISINRSKCNQASVPLGLEIFRQTN